jgi:acetylornithine deacetylase/succinyl-diaminopimelate desuccinylase-like protein
MTILARSAAAAITLFAGASVAHAQTTPPQEYMDLAHSILQELIEINTVNSELGNNTAAARAAERWLLAEGFSRDDVHVLIPSDQPTKGNLVARYRGRDTGKKPILLLAHIDVVEALPEDWSAEFDPFTFTERDGFYYGRGVSDDKNEAAIHIANLIRMKREGFEPDRDIIVALTSDEEGGPANGVTFLIREHPDLIDAEFALNEGGGGMERDGLKISNNVQLSEKKFVSYTFEATNPGGHSSLPVRKNAIYDLAGALLAVQDYQMPVMLNEVTRAFFSQTGTIVGGRMGEALARVVANPDDAEAVTYASQETAYNARLRTTCVATLLQGGHASNALPQSASATVNCRLLPDHAAADVHSRLQGLAAPFDVTVRWGGTERNSPPSPLVDAIMGPIEMVTEQMWPGIPVVPVMLTGATDGSRLRLAGIPTYGVSGVFGDMDDVRAHGRDERIKIKHLYEGQEFLYRLVKVLSSGPMP